ncbi:reverse transcriptase domain-containing protein [Tanacetum coccineum]|uniref:Reverse transcriptase domain-containing protein n=1 Tax=Tanacetum coccineum TaxID=301880 RepID=A0ABQ5CVH6_9ASTR
MDSEREKQMLKERDEKRLLRKRKATISEEQPSKKVKLRTEIVDEPPEITLDWCMEAELTVVPEKLGDPEKFLIPCILQDLKVCNSLAVSRASINLMPLSIYKKLGIGSLKPTRMTLELADRYVALLKGIAQDVIVRVDKFNFLVDFVVVDFEADPRVPIILGRPLLSIVIRSVVFVRRKFNFKSQK